MLLWFFRKKVQRVFVVAGKVLRISTYGALVLAVLGVAMARSVYASSVHSLYDVERQWKRQSGVLDEGSYRILVNGQAMLFSNRMTDLGVHDALAAAENECVRHSGGIGKDIARLPGVAVSKLMNAVFGVVHREWDGGGYVACIQREDDRGVAGSFEDMRAFVDTGDLAKIGTFQYVFVERSPGATKTHVRHQRTDGQFVVTKLFPRQGDAPGSDLPEVPRPEGSRRILDASIEGSPLGARVYDAPGAPDAILAKYDRDLANKGWKLVELPERESASMRVYDLGPSDVFISAAKNGEATVVSIVDMPPN